MRRSRPVFNGLLPNDHRIVAGFPVVFETRDLVGGQSAVVLSVPKLPTGGFEGGFSWLADGRLIYSRGEAALGLGSPETNLWEIRVDARNGKRSGEPKRITNLTELNLTGPSAAADGKRLVFCRINAQADVYIGDLEAGQSVLKLAPRRLTWDERNDWPMAWTPDNVAAGDVNIAPAFRIAIYEDLMQELAKSRKFKPVFRSGDRNADGVPDLLILRTTVESLTQGVRPGGPSPLLAEPQN
jgi:hypothetical protein